MSNVRGHMKLIFTLIFIISTSALAADAKTRPASETDFVNYWRIILIPNELHKSEFKNESMGFSDPCQFLVIKSDGSWHNLTINNMAGEEASRNKCPTKKSEVNLGLFAVGTSPHRWNKLPNRDGLFFVKDMSVTDPKEKLAFLWKADLILEDIPSISIFGTDLKKNYMLMQLTKPINHNVGQINIAPIWGMILRPLKE